MDLVQFDGRGKVLGIKRAKRRCICSRLFVLEMSMKVIQKTRFFWLVAVSAPRPSVHPNSNMTESKQTYHIERVGIKFCDRELRGVRSDVHRVTVTLDGKVPDELLNRLWKKAGQIQPEWSPMGGRTEGTGQLMYRNADRYDVKDIDVTIAMSHGQPVLGVSKLSTAFGHDNTNISDRTEYLVIKTYLRGQKAPHVSIHPVSFRTATPVATDTYHRTHALSGSPFFSAIDLDFLFPAADDENYVPCHMFEYLTVRDDVTIEWAKRMYEDHPPMAMGGGRDSGEAISSAQAVKMLPDIVKIDKLVAEELAYNQKHPVSHTAKQLADMATKLALS